MFNVVVNNTSKRIRSELLANVSPDWPYWGDVAADYIRNYLGLLSWITDCTGGCDLSVALVDNLNQLVSQIGDKSNATLLSGNQDYFNSLVDNMMVHLYLCRLVTGAPNPTEDVIATVNIPSLVFGDKTFVWIISVLNMVTISV